MVGRYFFITLGICLLSGLAKADIEALTAEGRRVLLKDDMTWSYFEEEVAEETEYISLTVVRKMEMPDTCKLGIKLENHLAVDISTLVPQFSAYIGENIRFQTVFKEFSRIRPTLTQYREILFTNIACRDIHYVQVHGADRCSIGELNRFSPLKGECLKKIRVIPSDVFKMIKQPALEKESPEDESSPVEVPETAIEYELE